MRLLLVTAMGKRGLCSTGAGRAPAVPFPVALAQVRFSVSVTWSLYPCISPFVYPQWKFHGVTWRSRVVWVKVKLFHAEM